MYGDVLPKTRVVLCSELALEDEAVSRGRVLPHSGSLLRMLAGTALVSVLTTGLIAVVTGLLADRLGPAGFGAYMLARRATGVLLPVCTLAMGVAVPRYVAAALQEDRREAYLLGGLLLGVGPCLLVAAIAGGISDASTRLFFQNSGSTVLLYGSLCLLIGTACHTILYGYYRGLGRMGVANAWQLGVFGIAPAAIIFCSPRSASPGEILFLMGGVACLTLGPLARHVWMGARGGSLAHVPGVASELACYGGPRVPGSFAMQSILVLGPFLASRRVGVAEAGYLLAGQVVFQLADVSTSAFGIVMLPRLASLQAQGKSDYLRDLIGLVVGFVVHFGLYLSLHLLVWSRPLILLWLGPQYTDAVAIVRILLIAVIPYTAFVMLRSIIDAVEVRAINTLNLLMALAATAAASALALRTGLGAIGLAGATAAGFWILALLTLLFLWKRLGLPVQHLALGRVLAINAALMVPALVVAPGLESRVGGPALLAGGALTEGGLLLAYCWLMWVLNVRWANEMMTRIAPRWESGSAQPERTCD